MVSGAQCRSRVALISMLAALLLAGSAGASPAAATPPGAEAYVLDLPGVEGVERTIEEGRVAGGGGTVGELADPDAGGALAGVLASPLGLLALAPPALLALGLAAGRRR